MSTARHSRPRPPILGDLQTLWQLVMRRQRGHNHAARLENFYASQADGYDDFRKRLLHGRETLLTQMQHQDNLDNATDGTWLDIGGGTGHNIEAAGNQTLQRFEKIIIVDLTPSLLAVAKRRILDHGWTNVDTLLNDATQLNLPPIPPVRRVTFSYSLTMIPQWFVALDRALQLLQPGGLCGTVDFTVTHRHSTISLPAQSWLRRTFWPIWFAADGVHLNPDHLPYLHHHLQPLITQLHSGPVPYLPFVRAPYYIFLGRKP